MNYFVNEIFVFYGNFFEIKFIPVKTVQNHLKEQLSEMVEVYSSN